MTDVLNAKQGKARATKMELRAKEMKAALWPDLSEEFLWDRKKASGFTTMPRTMAYLMNIIDCLSKKGQPAGMTYLTIWCRLFFPGIVELASEKQMASETGFTGERAVDTWRKRMRQLKQLGFIDYQGGTDHDFQWVLVYNPHHVVQRLGDKVPHRLRVAWIDRTIQVGAKDTGELPELAIERKKKEAAIKTATKKSGIAKTGSSVKARTKKIDSKKKI